MTACPKYVPYRNKKILAHANSQACQNCGTNNGSTVAAHSNLGEHGKGVGKKSDDCFVAYLCGFCHDAYDKKFRTLEKELVLSQADFNRAVLKTMKLWIEIL